MASPQKEHGFTPIAHEILEALARCDEFDHKTRILMLILRESYGRQSHTANLSLREISMRTGINKAHVSRAMRKLKLPHLVTPLRVTTSGNHLKFAYKFQKDYHQWGVTNSGTVTRSGNGSVTNSGTPNYKVVKERKDNTTLTGVTGSVTYERPKDPVGLLVLAYKLVKGFREDDRAWDRRHWPRFSPSAKKLLEVFEGNYEQALACLRSLSERFDNDSLTWVLDTVVRHADEWKLRQMSGPVMPKKSKVPSWQYQ